jgi:hypothetical protein
MKTSSFDPQASGSGGIGDILSNSYVRIGLYILVAILIIYIILLLLRKYTKILDNKFGDLLDRFLPFFSKTAAVTTT